MNHHAQNPMRTGFCDAILGRDANNPYRSWNEFKKAQQYNSGYLKGSYAKYADKISHVSLDALIVNGVVGETACNQD